MKWNLFDGLKKQKSLEKAKINIEVNTNKQEQVLLKIEKEVQNYYDEISKNNKLFTLETQNRLVAQQNLDRSRYLLNNGSITSLQFRQSQLNFLRSENRVNNLLYKIKVLDYQLLRMVNELVE